MGNSKSRTSYTSPKMGRNRHSNFLRVTCKLTAIGCLPYLTQTVSNESRGQKHFLFGQTNTTLAPTFRQSKNRQRSFFTWRGMRTDCSAVQSWNRTSRRRDITAVVAAAAVAVGIDGAAAAGMTSWGTPGDPPPVMTSHKSLGESGPDRRRPEGWGKWWTGVAGREVRPWSDGSATIRRRASSAWISRWVSCSSSCGSGTRPWPGARWGGAGWRSPSASVGWCRSSSRTLAPVSCSDSECTACASYDPTRTTGLHIKTLRRQISLHYECQYVNVNMRFIVPPLLKEHGCISPRNTKLVIKQLHSVKSQVKTVRFQSSPEGCSLLNYS